MSTVVITGSTRGFGFEQAKQFRKAGYNVVLSGVSKKNLDKASEQIKALYPQKTEKVYRILGDYPETIARYVVPKMIRNQKNNARII